MGKGSYTSTFISTLRRGRFWQARLVSLALLLSVIVSGCLDLNNPVKALLPRVGATSGNGSSAAELACTDLPPGATTYNALGAGTSSSPYVICNAAQLAHLAQPANSAAWSLYFAQRDDIDLTGYDETTLPPIGTMATPFTGVYDGEDNLISDLTWNNPGSPSGLFAVVTGATAVIKRVHLRNVSIDGAGAYSGTLVGVLAKSAQVLGCSATGRIDGSTELGGLVGVVGNIETWSTTRTRRWTHGVVSSSWSTVSVGCDAAGTNCSVGANRGGLIGYAGGSAWIVDSYSTSAVDSDTSQAVGGLVGYCAYAVVLKSYAAGTVNARAVANAETVGGYVGGLVGYGEFCTSSNSFAAATEIRGNSGTATVGLLIGGETSGGSTLTSYVLTGLTINNAGAGGTNVNYTATTATAADLQTVGASRLGAGNADWTTGQNWADNVGNYPELTPAFHNETTWGSCAAHSADTPFAGGTGTHENPYIICTAAQLGAMDDSSAYWFLKNYELRANIDLAGFGQTPFPISHAKVANTEPGFPNWLYMRFNGNNNTISNFTLDASLEGGYGGADRIMNGGLFGFLVLSSVHNLTLSNPTLSGVSEGGALAGTALLSHLSNITVTGGSISNGNDVGGITEGISIRSSAENLTSSIGITCEESCAGVIKKVNTAWLTNATYSGTITGAGSGSSNSVAGIVATSNDGVIETSTFTGAITLSPYSVTTGEAVQDGIGGIVGETNSLINKCRSSGTISVTTQVDTFNRLVRLGGIVGHLSGDGTADGTGYIQDSYSTTSITFSETQTAISTNASTVNIGGILGDLKWVTPAGVGMNSSYSSGAINVSFTDLSGAAGTTVFRIGGILGTIDGDVDNSAVQNSFSVGSVVVPAANNTNTGRAVGYNNDPDGALVFNSAYHLGTSTCTNCDFGDDAQTSTQAALGDFYNPANAPMTGIWDFVNIWLSNNPTALPTLR